MSALLDEVDQEIESRRKASEIAEQHVANGNLPQDEEQPSVKVLGMEMTASCEGGKRWSRPDSPVLPVSPQAPQEPVEPPQEIFLEGALPAQSHLLVADSATEAENISSEEDPAVVLAGKMTLSVISLDSSENGTDESDKKQERSSSNISDDFEKVEAEEQVEEDENVLDFVQRLQEIQLLEQIQNEIKEIEEKDIVTEVESVDKPLLLQSVEVHLREPTDIQSLPSDVVAEFIEIEKDQEHKSTEPESVISKVDIVEQPTEQSIIEEISKPEKETITEDLSKVNEKEIEEQKVEDQNKVEESVAEIIEQYSEQKSEPEEEAVTEDIVVKDIGQQKDEEQKKLEESVIKEAEIIEQHSEQNILEQKSEPKTEVITEDITKDDVTDQIEEQKDVEQNNVEDSVINEAEIIEQHSEQNIVEHKSKSKREAIAEDITKDGVELEIKEQKVEESIINEAEATEQPSEHKIVEQKSTPKEEIITEDAAKDDVKEQIEEQTDEEQNKVEETVINAAEIIEQPSEQNIVEQKSEPKRETIAEDTTQGNGKEQIREQKDEEQSNVEESVTNEAEIIEQHSEQKSEPEKEKIAEDSVEKEINEQKVEQNKVVEDTQLNNLNSKEIPPPTNISAEIPQKQIIAQENRETVISELREASKPVYSRDISELSLPIEVLEPALINPSKPVSPRQLKKTDDEKGTNGTQPQSDGKDTKSEPLPTSDAENKADQAKPIVLTSTDEKDTFDKLNAAISDLSSEFRSRGSERDDRIDRTEEPSANDDEEIVYEYEDSDNEVVDEEIRNVNRLDDGLEDVASGRLNGEDQEHSKYGTTSSATLAENDISDEDEDDVEVQEIIEYITEDEEEIEDIIELACTNNTNHLPDQPGAQ